MNNIFDQVEEAEKRWERVEGTVKHLSALPLDKDMASIFGTILESILAITDYLRPSAPTSENVQQQLDAMENVGADFMDLLMRGTSKKKGK